MEKRNFGLGMLVLAIVFGMTVVGCGEDEPEYKINNTISTVSISLGYGNDVPKVGSELTATVRNMDGYSASGVSYQWKRADSQYSSFANISSATSYRYTPTIEDTGKYIKVEATNSDTTYPVESSAVGPVDANQVAKPTVDPSGGEVVPGQEITLTTATAGYGVVIYYTLDGTTPTTSSTVYSSYPKPKITSSCTLKAIARNSGMVDSEVLSVTYTVISAPAFSSVDSTFGSLYSVTYGNGKFVVGGSGNIAYSTDGTTWTNSTNVSDFNVSSIVYTTQFVAVGYKVGNNLNPDSGWQGIINYSSDGTSWSNVTDSTFGTNMILDVAYGGGRYVAVGENGKIAYSTNGTSWTAVSDSTFGTSTIYGVTYAIGKFVAVGSSGKMAYSTDGTTWTAIADSKITDIYTIRGITYGGSVGNEKFIAVGGWSSTSVIAYSTDGITWTRVSQSISDSSSLNRVVWGGNKFVAVADKGIILFSTDGTYWAMIEGGTGVGKSQFNNTSSLSSINDITYGNGKFLAVGINWAAPLNSGEMAISQ